jgi:two-component system chemotaxis response regulator CheY
MEGGRSRKMKKHRIMVVDDSRVIYMEMSKMLEDTDIEIAAFCRSGEEALEQYEAVKPDLVTIDIVMPGMIGLEAEEAMISRWTDANV